MTPKNQADPEQEQRNPDQDAAIEAAFVAGRLPEEDRRAPEEPERMTGEQFAAMQSIAPSVRRVTVVATARGFDGAVVIEAGEQFTIDLTDGQEIPAWSTLVSD